MRVKISRALKISIVVVAAFGLLLALFRAEADGYSSAASRLLYFTNQSNIWIALTALVLLTLDFSGADKSGRVYRLSYCLKFIFTVAISLTCFVFFVVLAPGAGEEYPAWTLSNMLVHAVTPALAIADFFVEEDGVVFGRRTYLLSVVPPLYYLAFCAVLYSFGVDFGRGDPFPYFFLNFGSPAGMFGSSSEMPYIIGSFYWMIFLLFLVLGLALIFFRLHPETKRHRNKNSKSCRKNKSTPVLFAGGK